MVARSRAAVRTGRRRSEGASAVEFALVAPILIALLLGITTAGITYSRFVSLNESVREGSRFGATAISSGTWGNTVRDRIVALSADGLADSQVCVRLYKGPTLTQVQTSTCTITAPTVPPEVASGLAATECLVVVWGARPSEISPLPFFSTSVTLKRSAFQRYERTC